MKKLALFIFIALGIITSGMTLMCRPCGSYQCPPLPKECPAGVAKDACFCCDVCAKAENEKCGGLWNFSGRCGDGLKCDQKNFQAEGVCRKTS